jgi:hypothetical protein
MSPSSKFKYYTHLVIITLQREARHKNYCANVYKNRGQMQVIQWQIHSFIHYLHLKTVSYMFMWNLNYPITKVSTAWELTALCLCSHWFSGFARLSRSSLIDCYHTEFVTGTFSQILYSEACVRCWIIINLNPFTSTFTLLHIVTCPNTITITELPVHLCIDQYCVICTF